MWYFKYSLPVILKMKWDELKGKLYEDEYEYELVMGIIEGMNHRKNQNNYIVERLIFN